MNEGKDSESFKVFVEELKKHPGDPQQIKFIGMDMSAADQKGAREYLPQARMVFDHFHLMQYYCVGLAKNSTVIEQLAKSFATLEQKAQADKSQQPLREFVSFEYRTKKSWSCARRVIGKAELLEQGS